LSEGTALCVSEYLRLKPEYLRLKRKIFRPSRHNGSLALSYSGRNASSSGTHVLERSEQLKRRKEIYEVLHPETKAHSPEKQRQRAKSEPKEIISPGFTVDTATKTNVTPRTVRQEVQIATKIGFTPEQAEPNFGVSELVSDVVPNVYNRDGRSWCSSLDVARHFGKRHDNLLPDIRSIIEATPEEGLLNFKESSYLNEQNKEQPCFEMTRSGFSILVMGFTGKDALAWKWKYIAAFDAMEAKLVESTECVIAELRESCGNSL